MKAVLFGLALLCALPGCCGMWKCKEKCSDKTDKKEMKYDKSKKDMKDKNYKK